MVSIGSQILDMHENAYDNHDMQLFKRSIECRMDDIFRDKRRLDPDFIP